MIRAALALLVAAVVGFIAGAFAEANHHKTWEEPA